MRSASSHSLRVIDFDLENRPLSYICEGWCSAEVTAIAWSWQDEERVHTMLLTASGIFVDDEGKRRKPVAAYNYFRDLLASADIVTGHYIRKHDLPILNSMLMELGQKPLPSLLVSDTKWDLVKRKDMSASQEALAAMLRLPEPKRHMTQTEWREANRLFTDERLNLSRSRVVGDVVQHKALRAKLIECGLLGPPKKWSSTY